MARKKLYGAAAKAHAKRLSKTRRKRMRSNPAKGKKGGKKKARKMSSQAVQYGPTRETHEAHQKRSKAAKKAARTRKRNLLAKKGRKSSSRRKAGKSIEARRAAARRRYHKKHPGAKRRSGVRALRKARRSIKRARRFGGRAKAYARRFHMRTNPRRRRHARRNPGLMGLPNTLIGAAKAAAPIAISLYLTRFIISKVGPQIPGLDKLGRFQGPALAAGMVVAANFATKKGGLSKYRSGIMLGTSLNLVDSLVKAFAPDSVKAMFGLGDSGLYDQAMGEYATVGDYLEVGDAEPIDDDITLSDYVEMSGVEEELGAIQEELGVEEDLGNGSPFGDDGPRRLGGVGQSSMLKSIRQSSPIGVVPTRSWVKQVRHAGPGYDNSAALYTGNFAGGFGQK